MFKEQIADEIKTRNVRGLFRVPGITDTNLFVVDTKEEDKKHDNSNADDIENEAFYSSVRSQIIFINLSTTVVTYDVL